MARQRKALRSTSFFTPWRVWAVTKTERATARPAGLFFGEDGQNSRPCSTDMMSLGERDAVKPKATANHRQSALHQRPPGQCSQMSNRRQASVGPPEYVVQPADRASSGPTERRWRNVTAGCGRCGRGERISVGRRWSYASFISSRHLRVLSAIHRIRLWSAWPTLQLSAAPYVGDVLDDVGQDGIEFIG